MKQLNFICAKLLDSIYVYPNCTVLRVCLNTADNITASLENAQGDEITLPGGKVSTLSLFCRCHRKAPYVYTTIQ